MQHWSIVGCWAVGLTALTMAVVRLSVRGLWNAIAALAVFIAIFAAAGVPFAGLAETNLMSSGLLPQQMPRSAILVVANLLAVDAVMVAACLATFAARLAWRVFTPGGAPGHTTRGAPRHALTPLAGEGVRAATIDVSDEPEPRLSPG